ncbi:unnamed protein product [Cuscuta campestris]|uniref:Uncharacterized protein n=1 Tax=Cuscuta campestris TaxID=132261 RepID=A0A484LHN2_9ASTE|nr:unnamed protein product [Cuscuta campestris]
MDIESLASEFGIQALKSAVPGPSLDQSLTRSDILLNEHWEGAEVGMGCEAPARTWSGAINVDRQSIPSPVAPSFTSYNPFRILESSEDLEETPEAHNFNNEDEMIDLFNCSSTARMMKLNALEDASPGFEEPALYTHCEGEKTVFIDSKLEPFRIITPSSSNMSLQLPKLAKGKATYSPSLMVTRSKAKILAAGRKDNPIKGVDTSDEESESFVEGIRSAFKRSYSLERVHLEDDEEDTPLYTNPQPQPKETSQVMVENEDQADEEEQEEAQEQEETELPIAWRTHRNHPLDQDKSRAATSGKSKSKSRAPTSSSEESLYYGDGSYLWFDSEEERTRFFTFFSKRVVAPPRIIPERYPELQGYDDLDAQLHQAGLWPFVSRARKEINPALIRAFYSNLRREDDVLYSLVKSTLIELTVEQLGRIAGLPFQGNDVSHYGGEDWVLNNEGLILNELGMTELKRHASGRPTIHSNPGSTATASCTHDHLLPYPFLVMDILERFKVTTTVGPLTKATKLWTISNKTFIKRSDNDAPATAAPRRTATAAGPAEPLAWANLASIADSLNRLHLKVDGMGSYLERLDVAVQRQGYAMNAYFQGINYVPPPLHGTFLGEVYDDEDEEDESFSQSSSPDKDQFEDFVDGDEMDVDDDEEETEDEA